MSNYVQTTFFAPKDSLLSGNPLKIIRGADVDPELANIATAIATKYDSTSIKSAPVAFQAGTANNPAITFGSSTTSGFYQPAANNLGIATSGIQRLNADANGAFIIEIPTSGDALTVNGASSASAIAALGSTGGSQAHPTMYVKSTASNGFAMLGIVGNNGTLGTNGLYIFQNGSDNSANFVLDDAAAMNFSTNSTQRLVITSTGGVTVNAPASGVALTVNGLDGTDTLSLGSTGAASHLTFGWDSHFSPTAWNLLVSSTDNFAIGSTGTGKLDLVAGSSNRLEIAAAGNVTVNAPNSGPALTVNSIAGTSNTPLTLANPASSTSAINYGSNYATSGTFTPSLGTNKPGTANTSIAGWIQIIVNGVQFYQPYWA